MRRALLTLLLAAAPARAALLPDEENTIGVFKDVPSLTSAFFTMPTNIAIAKVLAKLGEVLTDLRDEELERNQAMKRSGFYYLLKLPEVIVKE